MPLVFPAPLRRVFALILLCCCLGVYAEPAPLVSVGAEPMLPLAREFEVFADGSGALELADVERLAERGAFQPYTGVGAVNFGYSHAAWWLRVRVRALPDAAGPRLLEVAFPTLDRVDLFWRSGSASGHLRSGDLDLFATRPTVHRHFVFPLELRADSDTELYLRVQSEGTLTIPVRLWQPAALHVADQSAYAAHALYYGMLIGLGLYNLLLWLRLREAVYLAYVAFVLAMACGQLALSGFGYQFIWPDAVAWQSLSLNCGFAATGLFGAWFSRYFLGTPQQHPRLDRVLNWFSWAFALTALGPLFGAYYIFAQATSLVGFCFAVVAVASGIYSLRRGNPSARFFLVAWVALLIGVALMALRNAALVPTTFVTANGIQFGSAIEMLLLSFALAERIQLLRVEKEEAAVRALQAEHARVQSLEESERMLEARVYERTEELAEANRHLQESEARLQVMAQHDPLTGLPNRSLMFDRLEHAVLRGQRNGASFAVMLIDLDGFKEVNDTYGHVAGDELLIEISDRLRAGVRASDTVARLGGDEFVVVLEDAEHDEYFSTVAEKVLQLIAKPVTLSVGTTGVGASIGLARFPFDGEAPSLLLSAADEAMYRAKRAGGLRIDRAS